MKMDEYWKDIKSSCPKAFKQLCKDHRTTEQWGEIDSPSIWGEFVDEPQWVLRHLFDFFDSKGINGYCYTSNGKDWYHAILINGNEMKSATQEYSSREEAELSCYKKAFTILENKI